MPSLSSFLYSSRLSTSASASSVAQIVKTARVKNALLGITGVLAFDGERFCQYVEGPTGHLEGLIERIEADPRHQDFTALLREELPSGRRFDGWSMAYAIVDGEEPIRLLSQLRDTSALRYFIALLPTLDMA